MLQPKPFYPPSRARLSRSAVCRSWWNIAAPVLLAPPLSVAVDALVDRATQRVQRRSNVDANGVRCFVAYPDASPSLINGTPVVIFLHELYGLQEREIEFCQDLAKNGYIALAPDTFNGRASKWIPRVIGFAIEKVFAREIPDYGVSKVAIVLEWLRSTPGFRRSTPIGIVGFCYGGGGAIRSAIADPESFASVGVFYGNPPDADSTRRLRCPVFAAYGTNDAQFPKPIVDAFEKALSFVPGSLLLRFQSQGHAFVADLASTQRPGASRDAWTSYLEFLNKTLQP